MFWLHIMYKWKHKQLIKRQKITFFLDDIRVQYSVCIYFKECISISFLQMLHVCKYRQGKHLCGLIHLQTQSYVHHTLSSGKQAKPSLCTGYHKDLPHHIVGRCHWLVDCSHVTLANQPPYRKSASYMWRHIPVNKEGFADKAVIKMCMCSLITKFSPSFRTECFYICNLHSQNSKFSFSFIYTPAIIKQVTDLKMKIGFLLEIFTGMAPCIFFFFTHENSRADQ